VPPYGLMWLGGLCFLHFTCCIALLIPCGVTSSFWGADEVCGSADFNSTTVPPRRPFRSLSNADNKSYIASRTQPLACCSSDWMCFKYCLWQLLTSALHISETMQPTYTLVEHRTLIGNCESVGTIHMLL